MLFRSDRTKPRRVGRFAVPVLTAHGIGDATVMVEGQSVLRQKMTASGKADQLVQVFVNSSEHSYWGDAHYPPLFEALLNWVEKGQAPADITATARGAGNPGGFNTDVPADWAADRTRPLCPYPQVARYKGTGSLELARSFTCR